MTETHNLPVEGVELKPLRKPDSVVRMQERITKLEMQVAELQSALTRLRRETNPLSDLR